MLKVKKLISLKKSIKQCCDYIEYMALAPVISISPKFYAKTVELSKIISDFPNVLGDFLPRQGLTFL